MRLPSVELNKSKHVCVINMKSKMMIVERVIIMFKSWFKRIVSLLRLPVSSLYIFLLGNVYDTFNYFLKTSLVMKLFSFGITVFVLYIWMFFVVLWLLLNRHFTSKFGSLYIQNISIWLSLISVIQNLV